MKPRHKFGHLSDDELTKQAETFQREIAAAQSACAAMRRELARRKQGKRSATRPISEVK